MPEDLPLELAEIRAMELEDLAELMAEPPHGHNHGRERGPGGWHPLETDRRDTPSYKRYAEPREHGTAYTYRKLGCRCPKCKAWKVQENRRTYGKRFRDPSG